MNHPLPEYPRAMRRDSYENLNGSWQYAITKAAQHPEKWDGIIIVPYSPESKASGISRTLQPGDMEAVWGVVRAGGVCIAEEFNADSVDPDGLYTPPSPPSSRG